MKGRFEIRDKDDIRGYRYTDLINAKRELSKCFPKERWFIFDRQEKKRI